MNIKNDLYYMHKALALAKTALTHKEIPIGAVIVDQYGTIIGRGYNKTETKRSQQEHAELRALRAACRKTQDWRLTGSTVYITLEPCPMCFYALLLSRCRRIVFAASSPLYGYHLDKHLVPSLYTKHTKSIEGGLCEKEAKVLLQSFFKQKRGEAHESKN